jgi:hypothetical protein
MSLLFESFMVFYMLEVLIFAYIIIFYYYKPKESDKKIWDPLGLQQNKEEVNVKKYRRTSR